MDGKIEDLEKRLHDLEHTVKKNCARIDKNSEGLEKLGKLYKKLQRIVQKEIVDRYRNFGTVRVSKTQVTAVCISLSLSLVNFFLQWRDMRPNFIWESIRSYNMFEFFSVVDLNQWIRPNFIFIVPVLIGLGLVPKYLFPKLNNKLIPVILFAIGFVMASIFGYMNSTYTGGARMYDTFIICGLSQGFATTAVAVMTYSMVHGSKRVYREWKDKKGVENDV